MQFEFATASRIHFGAGVSKLCPELARTFGRSVLVVTGRNPSRAERIVNALRAQGLELTLFPVSGEPDLALVERGTNLAHDGKCEVIVAIGGGSVLDTGKAIAATLANPGPLLDFLEVIGGGKPLTRPSLPVIAIPTSAGTGAEVTRNAVLFSPEHRVKVSLRSPHMLPKVALVDPNLTLDLPPALTASTGLDALTQVIEPYVCNRPNPVTDALCEQGMRRAARSLPAAFRNGADTAAREDMALTSLFGGLALANAGLGAVHGFAGPIGGMFDAGHGAICAALLPHVTAVNLRALQARQPEADTLARYQTVARLVTDRPTAVANDAVPWLMDLVRRLEIRPLGSYGISRTHFDELADKAARASSMKANPIVLTRAELIEILERAL